MLCCFTVIVITFHLSLFHCSIDILPMNGASQPKPNQGSTVDTKKNAYNLM